MEYLASTMLHCAATVLTMMLLTCHTMARPTYNRSPVIFTDYPATYADRYYPADYGPGMDGNQYAQPSYPEYGGGRSYRGMSPGPRQRYMPSSRSGYRPSRSSYRSSRTALLSSRPLYPSSQSFISQGISPFRRYNDSPKKRSGRGYKKTGFAKKSTVLPKVITKPLSLTKKRLPDVLTDSLANIMPHPSPSNRHLRMKKKRRRFHTVARAKSFSGILKGTALGINHL